MEPVNERPTTLTPVEIDRAKGGDVAAPIVVELGKKRRKEIKRLKRGEGPLVKQVADVIEQARTELAGDLAGKTLLPLVLIYRKKPRRSRPTLLTPFGRS